MRVACAFLLAGLVGCQRYWVADESLAATRRLSREDRASLALPAERASDHREVLLALTPRLADGAELGDPIRPGKHAIKRFHSMFAVGLILTGVALALGAAGGVELYHGFNECSGDVCVNNPTTGVLLLVFSGLSLSVGPALTGIGAARRLREMPAGAVAASR